MDLGIAAWEHWASKGVPVFPCGDDKRPLCKWRQDASTEREDVLSLFARRSGKAALIGAALGEQSGLFALDFDLYKSEDAGSYKRVLEAAGALPPTRVHRTRSGGLHYLYFVPDGYAIPRNSVPHAGVEIRGEGGYIIVPPSPGYEIQSSETAEAPVSLINRLARSEAAFRELTVSGLKQKIIEAESFHEALMMLAAKLHGVGSSPEEVLSEMTKAMMGSVAANPMHDRHDRWAAIMRGKDGELARISGSAYKKYNPLRHKDDVAVLPKRLKQRNRDVTVGGLFSAPKKEESEDDEPKTQLVSPEPVTPPEFPFERSYHAARVSSEDDKAFLLFPLIMEGDVVVLSAAPKAGKTMTAMTLCLHMASGLAMGEDLVPLDKDGNLAKLSVIYFALEGQGAVRKRVRGWLQFQRGVRGMNLTEEDVHLYVVERGINLASKEQKQDVVDKTLLADLYFKQRGWSGLSLVVFDTLTKAMPGKDQNSVEDTSEVFATVDMMREVGIHCSVMFIHHNNRQGKGPRGSSNILAEPDTILSVDRIEPVEDGGIIFDCYELSVYMARAIDDTQRYKMKAHVVDIGKNRQGIIETAPVLELIADYQAMSTKTETTLKKVAAKAKGEFYGLIYTALSNAADMKMTITKLHKVIMSSKNEAAISYYGQFLNANNFKAVVAAWTALLRKEAVPASLGDVAFSMDEHNVYMALDFKTAERA